MAKHELNEAQKAAVYADNPKILVSAGAGTGKSSTMTDRIMRILTQKLATLDQMLVITFTREAAGSIRQKIREALTNQSHLPSDEQSEIAEIAMRNLNMLPSSSISTIHSFCGRIVRDGAIQLGIAPDYQVIDENARKTMFEQAVKDALNEIAKPTYPKSNKTLIGAFKRSVQAKAIPEVCAGVYDVLMGIPNPFSRIEEIVEKMDAPDNPWKHELFKFHKQLLLSKHVLLEEMKALASNPLYPSSALDFLNDDIAVVARFLKDIEAAATIDELVSACETVAENISNKNKPKSLSENETILFEEYKTLRGYFKNKTGRGNTTNYVMYSVSALSSVKNSNPLDIQRTKNQAKGLILLLEEIHNQFHALKTGNETKPSMLDYSDMEQYCYQLLTDDSDTGIRDAEQTRYKYIFIDECQDVSAIQHAIINALTTENNNVFYVGDIKQSIYRFRHADPLAFLSMRDSYSENEDAKERKIFFQHNYRSSDIVISCVNSVFSTLMDRSMTEIDYEPGDYLIHGSTKENKSSPTEVWLVNSDIDKDPVTEKPVTDILQAQCYAVGKRIAGLLEEGYSYKDIVILLRGAKTAAPSIKDWLGRMHIPCYYGGKQNFFSVPEVAAIVDTLRVINNEYQDYPLISTLRNMPFNFSDAELAEIRLAQNDYTPYSTVFHRLAENNQTALEQKCHAALEQIRIWKTQAEVSKPSALIWRILKEHGIYALEGAMPDGEMRQRNLYAFHQKALDFEANGNYSLSDFISSIDILEGTGGGSEDAIPMGEKDDFVRIMTIHASKGLEFPIVIIMDAQKDIHHKNSNRVRVNIESGDRAHDSLGIYMPYANITRHIRRDTYGCDAFSARQFMTELAEESRMLYVAMTRAMNKLIITGAVNLSKTDNWYEEDKTFRVLNTRSILDMVMPAALNGATVTDEGEIVNNNLWNVQCVHAMAIEENGTRVKSATALPVAAGNIDFDAHWNSILEDSTTLPAKTAVTSLVSHSFEAVEETTSENIEDILQLKLPDEIERPLFMQDAGDIDYAEIGTLTHSFLSNVDMELIRDQISKGENSLNAVENAYVMLGFGSKAQKKETEFVSRKMLPGIAKFLESSLGKEMLNSRETLMREKPFVYSVMVDDYTILVQGVVDAMFMDSNGEWVIIDYKTDSDTSEEAIRSKHTKQLNYYRDAIERVTRIPVSTLAVVAVRTGDVVEIEKNTPEYA